MTRTVAREIAIQLSFAAQLAGDDARETADTFFSREYFATLAEEDPLFLEYPDEKQLDYIRRLTGLVYDHMYELNHMIEKYARGWRLERISRVAAAIMRCAMCEILYMDDVPNAAAINEAVELAKGYEEPETVAFINEHYGKMNITCDDYATLFELMTHDKKNVAGTINFTLLGGIGDIRINQTATRDEIFEALDFYREGN